MLRDYIALSTDLVPVFSSISAEDEQALWVELGSMYPDRTTLPDDENYIQIHQIAEKLSVQSDEEAELILALRRTMSLRVKQSQDNTLGNF